MGKNELAQKIRQARKNAGLTQIQAAAAVGVNSQTISDYERGRTRIPSDILLQKLCPLYNISLSEVGSETKSDDQPAELWNILCENPGMRALVSALKDADEEDMQRALIIIEGLKKYSERTAD